MNAVGYRYGDAPESGYSRNHATGQLEAGVSMAGLGGGYDCSSFAVMGWREAGERKQYYTGTLVLDSTGSDGEPLLSDVTRISRAEYLAQIKGDAQRKAIRAWYRARARVAIYLTRNSEHYAESGRETLREILSKNKRRTK